MGCWIGRRGCLRGGFEKLMSWDGCLRLALFVMIPWIVAFAVMNSVGKLPQLNYQAVLEFLRCVAGMDAWLSVFPPAFILKLYRFTIFGISDETD